MDGKLCFVFEVCFVLNIVVVGLKEVLVIVEIVGECFSWVGVVFVDLFFDCYV